MRVTIQRIPDLRSIKGIEINVKKYRDQKSTHNFLVSPQRLIRILQTVTTLINLTKFRRLFHRDKPRQSIKGIDWHNNFVASNKNNLKT